MSAAEEFRMFIRSRRIGLGLRQLDVARAIGFETGEAIAMVEGGHRRLPFDRVPALARVLELPEQQLVRIAMRALYPEPFRTLFPAVPPEEP